MLSLEAQGRDREGLDRSLQKRVNGFAATRSDRPVDSTPCRGSGRGRGRARSVRPGTSSNVGICSASRSGSFRHCTTCAHCLRHSTKRSWRRASSSKLCAMTTRSAARIDPARERVDHRPLVQRPVGEIRIDEDDLARAAARSARVKAARTASRNSAREAIGDDVVGAHVVSSSKRSGFGHAPAGAQPLGEQLAGRDARAGDAARRRAGAGRRAGASVSHRVRRRDTPRR